MGWQRRNAPQTPQRLGAMQENTEAFEERDCGLVRALVAIAGDTQQTARTLAVACNDLAQFAAAHPSGRYIVADCGGKAPVMRLMGHGDAEVQKHALLCVQRLMLGKDKLDFLKRPHAAAGEEA